MNLRSPLFSVALLACVALTQAQDVSRKLDYKTVAIPLDRALREISKQAGIGLFADEALGSEIIILRLHEVTTQEAMKQIAKAIGGEWRKAPDGFELYRSADMADKLHAKAVDIRAQAIKKAIDEKVVRLKLGQPMSDQEAASLATRFLKEFEESRKRSDRDSWRKFSEMRASFPTQRALWQLLSRIDPRTLADVEESQKVVYSTIPTSMQRELRLDLRPLAEQIFREQRAFAQGVATALKDQPKGEDQETTSFPGEQSERVAMRSVPEKFVLVIDQPYFSEGLSVTLAAVDDKGKLLFQTSDRLGFAEDWSALEAEQAKVVTSSKDEPDIALSPISKALMGFMQGPEVGTQTLSGEAKQAILHPEQLDPLATATSEAMLGLAEYKNVNLVMYPDDAMFMVAMFAGQSKSLKPSVLLQSARAFGSMMDTQVIEEPGWLLVVPNNPLETYRNRTNREALGVYLREVDAGEIRLNDFAELASTIRGINFPVLMMFMPMLVGGQLDIDPGSVDMLRFYASLGEAAVSRLQKQPTRIANLNKEQLGLLYRYVFESRDASVLANAERQALNETPAEEILPALMGSEDTVQDTTEQLPDGLPMESMLSVKEEKETTYFVKADMGGVIYTHPTTIESLAWMLAPPEKGEEMEGPPMKILSISPGVKRTLTFTIALPGNRSITSQLKENLKGTDGPWTADTLPNEIKKQIQQLIAQAKQEAQAEGEGEEAPPPESKTPPPAK